MCGSVSRIFLKGWNKNELGTDSEYCHSVKSQIFSCMPAWRDETPRGKSECSLSLGCRAKNRKLVAARCALSYSQGPGRSSGLMGAPGGKFGLKPAHEEACLHHIMPVSTGNPFKESKHAFGFFGVKRRSIPFTCSSTPSPPTHINLPGVTCMSDVAYSRISFSEDQP